MKTKIFIVTVIIGFLFGLYSCESKSKEIGEDGVEIEEDGAYVEFLQIEFTESELERVAYLKSLIPDSVVTEFEEKYFVWVAAGRESARGRSINMYPYYTLPEEWKILLDYCFKYDKALYTLVLDKTGYLPTIYLLQGLAGGGEEIFEPYYGSGGNYIGDVAIMKLYSKDLLAKEYDNILKSIREHFYKEEE